MIEIKSGTLKEVSIKDRMPTADEAIKMVTYHIKNAKPSGIAAVKLIHGYGSTGKGGKIRIETRKYLDRQKIQGHITDYIKGEDFSIFNVLSRSCRVGTVHR